MRRIVLLVAVALVVSLTMALGAGPASGKVNCNEDFSDCRGGAGQRGGGGGGKETITENPLTVEETGGGGRGAGGLGGEPSGGSGFRFTGSSEHQEFSGNVLGVGGGHCTQEGTDPATCVGKLETLPS